MPNLFMMPLSSAVRVLVPKIRHSFQRKLPLSQPLSGRSPLQPLLYSVHTCPPGRDSPARFCQWSTVTMFHWHNPLPQGETLTEPNKSCDVGTSYPRSPLTWAKYVGPALSYQTLLHIDSILVIRSCHLRSYVICSRSDTDLELYTSCADASSAGDLFRSRSWTLGNEPPHCANCQRRLV